MNGTILISKQSLAGLLLSNASLAMTPPQERNPGRKRPPASIVTVLTQVVIEPAAMLNRWIHIPPPMIPCPVGAAPPACRKRHAD